jgi:hypothetical protein
LPTWLETKREFNMTRMKRTIHYAIKYLPPLCKKDKLDWLHKRTAQNTRKFDLRHCVLYRICHSKRDWIHYSFYSAESHDNRTFIYDNVPIIKQMKRTIITKKLKSYIQRKTAFPQLYQGHEVNIDLRVPYYYFALSFTWQPQTVRPRHSNCPPVVQQVSALANPLLCRSDRLHVQHLTIHSDSVT